MLVVVGGHSRNIGKTSVVAGLIAALPQANWTAMKITQHGHGFCVDAGAACGCETEYDHLFALSEETEPSATDSGRFLAAGAKRSYWLRTAMGQLGHALPAIREILASSENVIVESNSLLQFVKPDLYLVVADFATADFKDSALRYLDRADALVTVSLDANSAAGGWTRVAPQLWKLKPRFAACPPRYVSEELSAFVCAILRA